MLILFLSLVSCKETIEPDGIWSVEVEGVGSDDIWCTLDETGFQQTYEYSLYYDGSALELEVDGDAFATGEVYGCSISYSSYIYLESSDAGDFRWRIDGEADAEASGGSCDDIPDQYDWYGTETLTVVDTDNDAVPEGCTYNMTVQGTYISD